VVCVELLRWRTSAGVYAALIPRDQLQGLPEDDCSGGFVSGVESSHDIRRVNTKQPRDSSDKLLVVRDGQFWRLGHLQGPPQLRIHKFDLKSVCLLLLALPLVEEP